MVVLILRLFGRLPLLLLEPIPRQLPQQLDTVCRERQERTSGCIVHHPRISVLNPVSLALFDTICLKARILEMHGYSLRFVALAFSGPANTHSLHYVLPFLKAWVQ